MRVTAPDQPGTKPYELVSELGRLRGPAHGVLELPTRIHWSGPQRTFDLDDDLDLQRAYRAVLVEGDTADQERLLSRDILISRWQEIRLAPLWLRRAWEAAFPELQPWR